MPARAEAARPGFLRRLGLTRAQQEAEELQREVEADEDPDLTPIGRCVPGETVTVRGMVRSVTMRPRSTAPALEVDLYDGSGNVAVVWLGRRRIPGIDPGRTMVIHGRMTCTTENPTIYNPRYELKPPAA